MKDIEKYRQGPREPIVMTVLRVIRLKLANSVKLFATDKTSNTLSRLSADNLGDVTIHGGNVMRRLLLATLLGIMLGSSIGCFVPIYSAEPDRRARQLMFTSEDLRAINDQWERIWFLDMPDHQTPFRTHGGII